MAKFKNTVKSNKISVEIDLSKEMKNVSSGRKKVLDKVFKGIKSDIRKFSNKQQSSVKEERFAPLSKMYKKLKVASGKGGKANLQFSKAMFKSIKGKIEPNKGKVTISITNRLEKLKAYNHNQTPQGSGGDKKVTLKKRRFLPTAKKEKFRKEIMEKAIATIKKAEDAN